VRIHEVGAVSEPPGFRDFVEARWAALYRFAYSLTADRGLAEDVVQQALERCWRRWRHIRTDGAEAYVRTVIARLVISRWRVRRVGETELDDAMEPPAVVSAEDAVVLRDLLWRALADLPPRMRAILVLRFVEDLTETQTARTLGCSVGTVKSQTSRGLARLRVQPEVATLLGAGDRYEKGASR
jgi:RNA polymerase sigma-70 factor (sigma-E family)